MPLKTLFQNSSDVTRTIIFFSTRLFQFLLFIDQGFVTIFPGVCNGYKIIALSPRTWLREKKSRELSIIFFSVFQIPEIRFQFHGGITEKLKNKLEQHGVHVEGEIKLVRHEEVDSDDEEDSDVSDQSQDEDEESVTSSDSSIDKVRVTSLVEAPPKSLNSLGTLNLDITAMIAYVSALTNGFANYIFKEPILSQQAEWERERPGKL
jgi:hypothetical protein